MRLVILTVLALTARTGQQQGEMTNEEAKAFFHRRGVRFYEERKLLSLFSSGRDGVPFCNEDLKALKYFKDVKALRLNLWACRIPGDELAVSLRQAPHVKDVRLSGGDIGEYLPELGKVSQLETVHFFCRNWGGLKDDDVISHLARLKHLRKLSITPVPFTPCLVRKLKKIKTLKELELTSKLPDDLLLELKQLTQIEALSLWSDGGGDLLDKLGQLRHLKRLDLCLHGNGHWVKFWTSADDKRFVKETLEASLPDCSITVTDDFG